MGLLEEIEAAVTKSLLCEYGGWLDAERRWSAEEIGRTVAPLVLDTIRPYLREEDDN